LKDCVFVRVVVYKTLLQNITISHFTHRYPNLTVSDISHECPFCRNNCNCSVCLRSRGTIKVSFLCFLVDTIKSINKLKTLPRRIFSTF